MQIPAYDIESCKSDPTTQMRKIGQIFYKIYFPESIRKLHYYATNHFEFPRRTSPSKEIQDSQTVLPVQDHGK